MQQLHEEGVAVRDESERQQTWLGLGLGSGSGLGLGLGLGLWLGLGLGLRLGLGERGSGSRPKRRARATSGMHTSQSCRDPLVCRGPSEARVPIESRSRVPLGRPHHSTLYRSRSALCCGVMLRLWPWPRPRSRSSKAVWSVSHAWNAPAVRACHSPIAAKAALVLRTSTMPVLRSMRV